MFLRKQNLDKNSYFKRICDSLFQLVEGIDGFVKKLKKMPKPVKALGPAQHLDAKMKEFKNAIPLFLDLKNEALRERLVVLIFVKYV